MAPMASVLLLSVAILGCVRQSSEIASGQGSSLTPAQVSPFVGTWAFTMTQSAHFKGSEQIVRIWNQDGRVAASVHIGKFPPNNVTGIHRDGDMLLLTLSHELAPPSWKPVFRS